MRRSWGCGQVCWNPPGQVPNAGCSRQPIQSCPTKTRHGSQSPGALADTLMHRLQMPAEEVHADTVSGWLSVVRYVVGNAVLGDQDLRRGVVAAQPYEDVIEALRIDLLPARCGDGMGWTGRPDRPSPQACSS